MCLDMIYDFLKNKREKMYEEGKATIELSQAEFFEVFQTICFLKQMKFIADNL